MSMLRQIAKSILTACVPRELILVRGPRTAKGKPRMALTFDDGPHPEHTPRLLDCLDRLGLTSTFFVIGERAEQYPDLVRRMVDAGHEVANHTYTHAEPKQTSPAKFVEEIRRTDQLLRELTGLTTASVRPPKGEMNWGKLSRLWRLGKTVVLWNQDPRDFRMTNPAEMRNWTQAHRPQDGDILLFHDNHPYAEVAVEELARRGVFNEFQTTTIQGWFGKRAVSTVERPRIASSL